MPALIGGETWAVIRARIEEIYTAAGTIATNLAAAIAAKTAAETAQTSAAGSASSASASASAASTSASSASSSATAAAGSATAAASSATTAGTHMSNASTQAANAAVSATAAASIYDAFDDRFLGAKPSLPTMDNDGNTLIVGALCFHTVGNSMKVWNGAAWLDAYVPSALYMQRSQNLADVANAPTALTNLGLTATAAELNVLDGADMAIMPMLATIPASLISSFNDPIINGSFRFWQRGITTSSAFGYVADRWLNAGNGGTFTMSRQTFALGDKFGQTDPTSYLRQTVSGQTLAAHHGIIAHRVEDVRRLAGRKITIMGWARRSSGAGDMAVNVTQSFGTGGSPAVQSAGKTVTLTGLWEPFAVDIDVPSIAGKSAPGSDSCTTINFFTSAGANFNAEANNLGLQTIGVDIWGVHVRDGLVPVAAVDLYHPPSPSRDQDDVYRYFEVGTLLLQSASSGFVASSSQFSTRKREVPSVAFSLGANVNFNTGGIVSQGVSDRSIGFNGNATVAGGYAFVNWTADAEI